MRPALGVLITYFNERDLLAECLGSLLDQCGRPDEILVYDDGSDAWAEEYVPAGSPVKVIRGEVNRGPSYGRNALLRASESDYIHFHDADDLFRPDWCRRVRDAIEATGADVVFTEVSSENGDAGAWQPVLGLERLLAGEDLVRFCIQGAMLVPAGTYRRSTVLGIGGYRDDLWQSEDFDFHVRLAASGIGYVAITDPLVRIRIRSSGRSRKQLEVWCSAVQAIEMLARELPRKYRPDLADAAVRAGSTLLRLGASAEARKAFELARELGPPPFGKHRPLYRALARAFGPEMAERVGTVYRTTAPERIRRYLVRAGW